MEFREFLQTVPALKGLEAHELSALDLAMRVEAYPEGHVFIREGDLPEAVYLIVQGEIRVTSQKNEEGGVEIDKKRVATVVFGKGRLTDRSEEEVRGYQAALSWIHSSTREIPIAVETILELHAMTKPGMWDSGRFKEEGGEIIEKHPDGRTTVRTKC